MGAREGVGEEGVGVGVGLGLGLEEVVLEGEGGRERGSNSMSSKSKSSVVFFDEGFSAKERGRRQEPTFTSLSFVFSFSSLSAIISETSSPNPAPMLHRGERGEEVVETPAFILHRGERGEEVNPPTVDFASFFRRERGEVTSFFPSFFPSFLFSLGLVGVAGRG